MIVFIIVSLPKFNQKCQQLKILISIKTLDMMTNAVLRQSPMIHGKTGNNWNNITKNNN